jgi:hypothetical protein
MAIRIVRLSSRCGTLALLVGLSLLPAGVKGQEAAVPLQFNYSDPGARSTGFGSGIGIDSTVGLRTATSDVGITGISFLSFVYPKGNWSLAFYRHSLANFEFFSETQGLFAGGTDCCQVRDFDMRAANEMDIASYGVSAAYQVDGRFDLGLGLVYVETCGQLEHRRRLPTSAGIAPWC